MFLEKYEKKRAKHDQMSADIADGGDPQTMKAIKKALKRMSYEYQISESRLAKIHQTKQQIKNNMQMYSIVQSQKPLAEAVQEIKTEDRDFKS